ERRPTPAVPAVERGVRDRVVLLVVGALQVLSDIRPERRLAVAADVISETDARRDVVVALDAVGCRERDRGGVEPARDWRAVVLRREPAPRVVEAQGPLQAESSHRPLVLRVEGAVRGAVADLPGSDSHRDARRGPLEE